MNQISIPKPCHENWENMLPEAQGKHCLACSKTVIDFSDWEPEKIMDYLHRKSQENVCGRFNITQLEPRVERNEIFPIIISSNITLLKKIAAIVLLCFGVMTSQEVQAQKKQVAKTKGKVCFTKSDSLGAFGEIGQIDTVKKQHPAKIDTSKFEPQIMGMIAPQRTIKKEKIPSSTTPKK